VVDGNGNDMSRDLCNKFGGSLKDTAILLKLKLLESQEKDSNETFSKLSDDELKNILLSENINYSVLDSGSIEMIIDFVISSKDHNFIRCIDFSQNKTVLHKIVERLLDEKKYSFLSDLKYNNDEKILHKIVERLLDEKKYSFLSDLKYNNDEKVLHKIVDHFMKKKDYNLFLYFYHYQTSNNTELEYSIMLDRLPSDDPDYMKWIHNLP
jgi:hypothetical protein